MLTVVFVVHDSTSVPPDDVGQLLLCHAFLLTGFLNRKPHRTKIKFAFAFFVLHVITT